MIYENEADFEEAVINVLKQHGWDDADGVIKYPTEADLIRNWAEILYQNNSDRDRLNGFPLTDGEMAQVIEQVEALRSPLALNGFINGKTVAIKRDNPDDAAHYGREVSLNIYDRREIAGGKSRYQIAQQPRYPAKNKLLNDRRGDLCLLINGMPLIHIELKRSGVSISQACNQIEKYSHEGVFTGIFRLVQLFVAMNPDDAVYFANPGAGNFNSNFYFHWADFNNEPYCANQNPGADDWKRFTSSLLSIPMAHQMIGFYTVADSGDGCLKVLRSYQYYAASSISDHVRACDWGASTPAGTPGRPGGYIWHTTGSGKTMTSFKAAQLVADSRDADKVVFLMDRIELGTQSLKEYRAFADDADDVQATENTDVLRHKLVESTDPKDTLIVTSIQKMSNVKVGEGGITQAELDRMAKKRIVFILDECHRSTFGTMLQDIRTSFPNALFFGFTGTPIQEENKKKGATTSMIFGNCLHRYSIADGIRDGNVLGFDPCMVTTYKDKDVRKAVALEQAKADSVEAVMENPKKEEIFYYWMNEAPMGPRVSDAGEYIKGVEDFMKSVQYDEDTPHEYQVINDIVEQFPILSHGNKFHAILATSSISEAISYYRRLKECAPQLKCTALFDPSIDNNDGATVKEDALVEIIGDYNDTYGKEFAIPTWGSMKKDISSRLAHKEPYLNIDSNRDKRIDILIVVDQMLTGFDSKWVNTLYLDKVIDYESIIQAFSRTNRLFGPEKPFGVIRYYRKPHTMSGYIKAAVKLYSGDKPLDLFVQKLHQNIKMMDARLLEIKALFQANGVSDLSRLPDSREARAKFAKDFVELSHFLESAQVQGFSWDKVEYEFEPGTLDESMRDELRMIDGGYESSGNYMIVKPNIDERTYLILAQRYKELFKSKLGPTPDDVPYDIDGHLTEIDTGKIDTDYMNSNFVKWLKALNSGDDNLEAASEELHRSFASLPQDEQRLAELFLHDVERGDVKLEDGKTLRDYITAYGRHEKDSQFDKVVEALGVDRDLLVEMAGLDLTEENINEYGRFDRLKNSIDKTTAKTYFERVEGVSIAPFKVHVKADELLKRFIIEGGFDLND
ncbi:type I site-specific deoxyribonuclease, HsdR family [Cryptobacterium curtum DSM 15641]|uniref:Type I restriction enzyme endonuclease subunit n=1 Tax=Cryptobacterium curtum (strain ATCC 700683 / DSM 15641 / CCUG 43107 / 12-3) TaxID=469378 RepID=C7MMA3_CRYCD|nr:HsdR family type I site-specific deoxyribonuclease [Cryptobacterium curtum]ACU94043.1 type I site-specific deoxyribonuclease, HsdR family [Cryptobacterium curtum DSM 15641]